MQAYIDWIVKNRIKVILFVFVITVGLISQLKNVTIIIDPDASLPQEHPYVVATKKIEEFFGNKNSVIVTITAKNGDVFQQNIISKIKKLTDEISKAPGLMRNNVLSIASKKAKNIRGSNDGLEVRPLLEKTPESEQEYQFLKEALNENPVYSNLIISKDEKTLSVIAEFENNKGGYRAIDDHIRSIVEPLRDESVEISIAGGPALLSVIEKFSARMGYLFPLAVILIGLIHYEAFRTIQALVFPLLTALLAVLWSLGFMAVTNVPLDVFNVTTPILILAVAAGHAVQMLKRYYEEFHRIKSEKSELSLAEVNQLAVKESVSKVGAVMIAAGTIAALGFFSLIIFEIRTIRTFGVFTGLGILSALFLEMTFIPALRAQMKAPGSREEEREKEFTIWDKIIDKFYFLATEKRKTIFNVTLIFVIIFAVGTSLVKMNDSTKSTLYGKLEIKIDDEKINQRLGGSNTLFMLIEGKTPDAIKNPKVLTAIDNIQAFLATEPNIGKTLSIVDFIKKINRSMNGNKIEFYELPKSQDLIAQYLFLYSTAGEPGDFDSYVDYNYQNASISALVKTDSSAYVTDLAQRLEPYAREQLGDLATFKMGGGVMVGAALTEVLVREKILNILQISFVVFIISSLLFRSFLAGALIMIPLIMTVFANFGVMGLTGIPLQMATALTSAMAVGIGADYAIYLTYRIREELALMNDKYNESVAIKKAFRSAGKAILFVSSAVAGGYALLMFSFGFLVHLWMGALISMAMIVASISALTIYPALLLSIRPSFVFKKNALQEQKVDGVATTTLILMTVILLTADNIAWANELNVTQIMEKNYGVSQVLDSISEATMTLENSSGQKRTRKIKTFTKLIEGTNNNRRFIRFTAPADIAGTSTLLVENNKEQDDIWIYLPALKKVRRIVASNKKESFVGTDFTYADVIGHKVNDWEHKIIKTEMIDGQDCYVIQSTPKTEKIQDDSGYSKRISWIRKDNFISIKGESYDQQNRLLKEFSATNIQVLDQNTNKYQPMKIEGKNVQTGHKTILEFDNYKINQGVQNEMFSVREMEKSL